MADQATGQVTASAADIYESFFLPALFAQWAPQAADAAGIGAGQAVLDVACGTGVLALEAARRVAPGGTVAGLDRNPGMLGVARRKAPAIDWREGLAEDLPFADASFDAVVCQFGLMFFADRVQALHEMWRVLRPGGRLAVLTFAAAERSPGYAAMIQLLDRLFGSAIAAELRGPFVLGDRRALGAPFAAAGIANVVIAEIAGEAVFRTIEAWVETEIKGWTLADRIDDTQYETLLRAAASELGRFARADGRVSFAIPALIATATKS